jgi:hypothetical protein
MKFPEVTKVGSQYYKAIWDDSLLKLSNFIGTHSSSHGDLSILKSDKFQSIYSIERTYLHEVFHAIDKIFNSVSFGEEEQMECVIDILANCIHMIFSDNPNLCMCNGCIDIPNNIKIGALIYDIEFIPGLDKSMIGNLSTYSNKFSTIKLDNDDGIPSSILENQFIGTLFSIIDDYFHPFRDIEDINTVISVFTSGLHQVLKDNPGICFCEN